MLHQQRHQEIPKSDKKINNLGGALKHIIILMYLDNSTRQDC